jgi:hypothetical protein
MIKNIKYSLFVFIYLFLYQTFAQNTNPVVTNVNFNISGTRVTVTYESK